MVGLVGVDGYGGEVHGLFARDGIEACVGDIGPALVGDIIDHDMSRRLVLVDPSSSGNDDKLVVVTSHMVGDIDLRSKR